MQDSDNEDIYVYDDATRLAKLSSASELRTQEEEPEMEEEIYEDTGLYDVHLPESIVDVDTWEVKTFKVHGISRVVELVVQSNHHWLAVTLNGTLHQMARYTSTRT